ERSGVAAEIKYERLPLSAASASGGKDLASLIQHCTLNGGDDYELCFTAADTQRDEIERVAYRLQLPLTRIGKIVSGSGCKVRAADGSVMQIERSGYDHFA
ncbi:MAG: thiamine-phosphate kinase, partial [Gallionellaceae bacterium]|nr:thiamine-phosphate kinase [Gallionellaceae bacterium]